MERMKTKAVRIHGKMDLRLEEIELPQVGPDDVQVKVISDSICMSTYKAAVEGEDHKRVPNDVAEHPTIVGHEFCGVITEVGENWKNKYKPGQGFAIQPAHFYKGSQLAPGYSYQYCGGDSQYSNIPIETMLPNSQLDRFLIRVSMGYPDHKSSVNILRDRHVDNPLDRAYAVVNKEELLGLVQDVRKVDMRDPVLDYVTTLVEKTRSHPQAALGVSPRGALAVCRMAKAYAYLHGRDFVMPEDVAAIFPDVCAHRLMLNSKARMMEEKPESVLAEILKTTDMPVLKK